MGIVSRLSHRGGTVLALALVVAATGVAWFQVAHTLGSPESVSPDVGRPSAFVWGDRVFSSRADFDAWLRSRGGSYDAWAKLHPALVPIVDPTARVAAPAPAKPAAAPDDGGPSAGSVARFALMLILPLVAILLAAAALAPRPLLVRLAAERGIALPTDYRAVFLAAAGSIALGIGIAAALSG